MSRPLPFTGTQTQVDFTVSMVNPDGSPASGSGVIATGQVAVTTSATLVAAARAGRKSITISSTSAVVFYVGAAGVTTGTGLYVAGAAGATVTLDTSAAVYAIGASAVTLSYLENY